MKLSTQAFVSHTKPEPDQIAPVHSDFFWKPRGGMWTSTLNERGGQWVEWLTGNSYALDDTRWGGRLWLLEPQDANVFSVDSPTELRELHAQFPVELPPDLRTIRSFDLLVDWAAMAKEYDGVHIPDPWPWRFGAADYEASMFFYVMDAECTCWFRWCFGGEPKEVDAAPYVKRYRSDFEEGVA